MNNADYRKIVELKFSDDRKKEILQDIKKACPPENTNPKQKWEKVVNP
jgi:hypothetical protein